MLGQIAHAKYAEIWRLYVLIPSITTYFLGGCFGAAIYSSWQKYSLTFSVILFFFIGLLYMISVKTLLSDKNKNIKYQNVQQK